MRVLAISGSLRKGSTNTAALEALARLAPEGVRVLLYQDLARLPPFNPDDDVEDAPKPEPVRPARARRGLRRDRHRRAGIRARRAGNAQERARLAGRERDLRRQAGVLINASPRAFHAQADLREILATMAARFVAEAFVTLPLTGKTFTADDIVADPVACDGSARWSRRWRRRCARA